MSKNLWWIRRDLRLTDNRALHTAMARGGAIVPVFILDPTLLSSPFTGDKRIAFLMGGLKELDRELRVRGSYLVVRKGRPLQQLAMLQQETKAEAIYAEEDFSPYARRRDLAIRNELPLKLVEGLTVHHPEMISKADGLPYMVFTPYSRRWKELPSPIRNTFSQRHNTFQRRPASRVCQSSSDHSYRKRCHFHQASKRRGTVSRRMPARMATPQLAAMPTNEIASTWMALPGCRPICAFVCYPPGRL